MKNLSLPEQLDYVLKCCITGKYGTEVTTYFNANPDEADELFDKLERDGFIRRKNTSGYLDNKPTIAGRIFHDKGGYERQEQIDKLHETVSFLNNKRIIRNEEMLVHATAIAIMVGLAILAWLVFTWFFPHYSDFIKRH